jgi:hemoglobin
MVSVEKPQSLYEKFGGHDGVKAVVDTFYEAVLAHPDVAPFFSETNMKKQRLHQTNFISLVLGGPNKYEGKSLREAHAHMKLTDKEFNVIAELLSNALRKHGVSEEDITSVLKVVATTHDDVLNL